jgi:hypothetical protein
MKTVLPILLLAVALVSCDGVACRITGDDNAAKSQTASADSSKTKMASTGPTVALTNPDVVH